VARNDGGQQKRWRSVAGSRQLARNRASSHRGPWQIHIVSFALQNDAIVVADVQPRSPHETSDDASCKLSDDVSDAASGGVAPPVHV
jgi:hypothetical protein